MTAAHCIDWLDRYTAQLNNGQLSIWIDINRDDVSPDNYTDHMYEGQTLICFAFTVGPFPVVVVQMPPLDTTATMSIG